MLRIAVSGATGKVGRRIVDLARGAGDIEVVAEIGRSGSLDRKVDCLIDFSVPAGTRRRIEECRRLGVPIVVGTTGLDADLRGAIDAAARETAVLVAANTSVGVNLLLRLVAEAARALGPGFDIEVIEGHHRAKRDSPSGTALEIVKALCAATGLDPTKDLVHGRSGDVGPRPASQIGVHAVRGGDIVGEHTVLFAGDGERVEIVHKASSRDTFARGALRAARFLAGKPPGRYTMAHVIEGGRAP